ncbi:MAG: Transcriptional regulator [Chaenotheca gracillima]|nr:MAG: Transcriptional regulator [Chaenotheca gracillima]
MPTSSLQPIASSPLSLPEDSYIYAIYPTVNNSLAAISSDDSLSICDRSTLRLVPGGCIHNVHKGVTCLKGLDDSGNAVATAGRDGVARIWDLRTGRMVGELSRGSDSAAILSLEGNSARNAIVTGTELDKQQAIVSLWDIRAPAAPSIQYVESHNDDVTELAFHPSHPSLLLSGSTDGLVNIYDTTQTDEDEALYRVINLGSSIHHAGFLPSRKNGENDWSDIYALSHDETLSIYSVTLPDLQSYLNAEDQEDKGERPPVEFGDLRPRLGGEYVVNVIRAGSGGDGAMAAVGNHSEQRLDLIPLTEAQSSPMAAQSWDFNLQNIARLPGAHGEDIVRDVYVDDTSQTVFTAGEDGQIRAWKPA